MARKIPEDIYDSVERDVRAAMRNFRRRSSRATPATVPAPVTPAPSQASTLEVHLELLTRAAVALEVLLSPCPLKGGGLYAQRALDDIRIELAKFSRKP